MNYVVTKNNKLLALALIVIGAISIAIGFMDPNSHREWSNLLLGNFFIMAVSLAGLFFLCIQYVAEVGWSAQLVRVFMAFGTYLPIAGICMLLIFWFGHHDLYHWTHHELYDPASAEYDEIMVGKSSYLNVPFYIIRMIAYFIIWSAFAFVIRKHSFAEDLDGNIMHHKKMIRLAAAFLVLFGVTSSTSAWDFIMSIDSHWYSTLFGWYCFAGTFISGLAVMNILVVYLKKSGYLPNVNESHLHDMGKFMFAFSIFWTYLWFAQFMLIWYANIPEEITYFLARFENYKALFITNVLINFFVPFLSLMTRDAKRKMNLIIFIGCVVFCGHWIDVFLMIKPGTVHGHWNIGIPEIGTTLFFLGMFLWVMFHQLAKAPLTPKNHPMLEESIHHQI